MQPICDYYGCTANQATIAYTLTNILCPVSMVISGFLIPKLGEKRLLRWASFLVLVGAILFGAWNSLFNLYVSYGLLMGFGTSTLYGIVATFGPKLFPQRSGMATGIIVTGLGVGMLIIPIISRLLLDRISIVLTIKILGCFLFALAQLSLTFMLPLPQEKVRRGESIVSSWATIFRTPCFDLLMVIMFGGVTSGLMLVSHTAVIASQRIGLNPAASAAAVSVVAIANIAGRFFWGSVSDKLNRFLTLALNFVFSGLMMALLILSNQGNVVLFYLGAAGVGFAYGGFMSVLPPLCSDILGRENITLEFGAVYIGFAAGGFFGPMLSNLYGGTFEYAFGTAIIVDLMCVGILALLSQLFKNKSLRNAI